MEGAGSWLLQVESPLQTAVMSAASSESQGDFEDVPHRRGRSREPCVISASWVMQLGSGPFGYQIAIIYIFMFLHIYMCIYISIYIYKYIYISIYIYIHMYEQLHSFTEEKSRLQGTLIWDAEVALPEAN